VTNIPNTASTGCIGYIGYKAFLNIFELLKKQQSKENQDNPKNRPIFAFSVLRIFDMEDIEKTFDHYDYSLVKADMNPIRQRRFSDLEEKQNTLLLLHNKGIDTKRLEDDGHFYADFYIASPKKLENQLVSISKDLKRCAGN
ncbi:MAG: hypothetical protein ACE5RB_06570, partial [Nitrosopumilus sp.]